MLLLTAAPAPAYTVRKSYKKPGRVVLHRIQGSHYPVECPYAPCWLPGVLSAGPRVYRSPKTSGRQAILVRYTLQRWDGSRWVKQWQTGHLKMLPRGQRSLRMPRLNVLPTAARYQRVKTGIAWARPSGRTLGARIFLFNHKDDYFCDTIFTGDCWTGPGWIYLRSPGLL